MTFILLVSCNTNSGENLEENTAEDEIEMRADEENNSASSEDINDNSDKDAEEDKEFEMAKEELLSTGEYDDILKSHDGLLKITFMNPSKENYNEDEDGVFQIYDENDHLIIENYYEYKEIRCHSKLKEDSTLIYVTHFILASDPAVSASQVDVYEYKNNSGELVKKYNLDTFPMTSEIMRDYTLSYTFVNEELTVLEDVSDKQESIDYMLETVTIISPEISVQANVSYHYDEDIEEVVLFPKITLYSQISARNLNVSENEFIIKNGEILPMAKGVEMTKTSYEKIKNLNYSEETKEKLMNMTRAEVLLTFGTPNDVMGYQGSDWLIYDDFKSILVSVTDGRVIGIYLAKGDQFLNSTIPLTEEEIKNIFNLDKLETFEYEGMEEALVERDGVKYSFTKHEDGFYITISWWN